MDQHCLRAMLGWLELGNAAEALVEWQSLSPAGRAHPDTLEVHWFALAECRDWDAAVPVAEALVAATPERASGWLLRAYALRRSSGGGLPAAFAALEPAAEKFPGEPTIPYNLACYACQMRRAPEESLAWLHRALERGDRAALLDMALQDADLEPLHPEIAQLVRA